MVYFKKIFFVSVEELFLSGILYFFKIKVILILDGLCMWYVLIIFCSSCNIDIIYFLFDD